MIDNSEREDFAQPVRNKGFEPDDFQLTEGSRTHLKVARHTQSKAR